MPILFRTDTRPPEEIFQIGFTPRYTPKLFDTQYENQHPKILEKFRDYYCSSITDDHNVKVINWFHSVLRPGFLPEDADVESSGPIMDVNPNYVVSLSYNLASTPIFPIDENISKMYIYAILLPEAKIPYYAKMRFGYPIEQKNEVLNSFIIKDDLAYDLHSLQTESIKHCCSLTPLSVEDQANSLCAYEAFAIRISPSNIICATECNRSSSVVAVPRIAKMTSDAEFSLLLNDPFDRTFSCGDIIVANPAFDTTGDRVSSKNQAINYIRSLANKTLKTTSICDGLAGKTFPVPYSLPREEDNRNNITVPTGFTPNFNTISKSTASYALDTVKSLVNTVRFRKKSHL